MKNIIEAIEAKLQEQADKIFFQKIEIEMLKKNLEAANAEIEALKKGCAE